jgi:hypothetical protein
MSVLEPRPDFDEAVRTFQAFLEGKGWPTKIIWSRPGDISRRSTESIAVDRRDVDGQSEARSTYEQGRRAGLGVSLEAVCTLGDAAVVTVAYPSDDREAELLMYPSDGGLKMCAAIPRIEGTARWSSC